MDRRQIDDVEAHVGDVRESARRGRERAVAFRRLAGGAREELVPGGEARQRPLDDDLERGSYTVSSARSGRRAISSATLPSRRSAPLLVRRIAVERRGVGEQSAALGAARPRGRRTHEVGALTQREAMSSRSVRRTSLLRQVANASSQAATL